MNGPRDFLGGNLARSEFFQELRVVLWVFNPASRPHARPHPPSPSTASVHALFLSIKEEHPPLSEVELVLSENGN